MTNRFNIRVYGLWINEQHEVLLSREMIKGQYIVKFPGGGLEWGEGTLDGLAREWQEELSVSIRIIGHYYTTHFFQPSAYDSSQVISIYYRVVPVEVITCPYTNGHEYFYFLPVNAALQSQLSLPIDQVVAGMLADAQQNIF